MPGAILYNLGDANEVLSRRQPHEKIVVVSPPFAPCSLGVGFWQEILRASGIGQRRGITAILDCGDHAGDVLAAIDAEIPHILYQGDQKTFTKLQELARLAGVKLYSSVKEV